MNYNWIVMFSFSILIAVAISWVRYKKIDPQFTPFIICLSVALVNEICSLIISKMHYTTAYNNNIYVLLEALLITWQFNNWGLFHRSGYLFTGIMLAITLGWTIENLVIFRLSQVSSYFRIGYSYLIVMMSINIMSSLIITYRSKLLRSSVFLICLGFIIYFTNKILFEVFWLYGLNAGSIFRNKVYMTLTWINLIVNLIYAIAVLWIPKKPQYITPY